MIDRGAGRTDAAAGTGAGADGVGIDVETGADDAVGSYRTGGIGIATQAATAAADRIDAVTAGGRDGKTGSGAIIDRGACWADAATGTGTGGDGVGIERTSDAHVGDVGADNRTDAICDGTGLADGLDEDGYGIGAAGSGCGAERERAVGRECEVIAAVVLQHHRARETGHRAADGVGIGGTGDSDVGDVDPVHRAGAVGDGTALARGLSAHRHAVGTAVRHWSVKSERTVGADGKVVAAVVLQYHGARETGHRTAHGVGIGGAHYRDVGDIVPGNGAGARVHAARQ